MKKPLWSPPCILVIIWFPHKAQLFFLSFYTTANSLFYSVQLTIDEMVPKADFAKREKYGDHSSNIRFSLRIFGIFPSAGGITRAPSCNVEIASSKLCSYGNSVANLPTEWIAAISNYRMDFDSLEPALDIDESLKRVGREDRYKNSFEMRHEEGTS